MTDLIDKRTGEFRPYLLEVSEHVSSGLIRGVLKRARTLSLATLFATVGAGYLDKYMNADLGVYNAAQGYSASWGDRVNAQEHRPLIIAPPITRSFHDSVLCSVNIGTSDAFLFDVEEDVHVDHPHAAVEGSVIFEAFNRTIINDATLGEPPEGVVGNCKFYVDNQGKRTYYTTDAFPDTIAGTRQQLLDPAFIPR